MAFRRGGGGPNNNRPFFNNRQPNAVVNPWQGGMAPGGSQINTQSLLGQLSEPQAQIALALSNLLTQSQHQQVNNPPSLLSLDINPRGFNNTGFRNNFSVPQRNQNRGRTDFRRPDSHINKNNYRDVGNKRSSPNRRNYTPYRKPAEHHSRSRDKAKALPNKSTENCNKMSSTNSTTKVVGEENNSKTAIVTVTEELASRSESEDGAIEEKRDWKAEKKTTDENFKDGKEKPGKVEGVDEPKIKVENVKDKETDKSKRNKHGQYGGIPTSYLNCNLCNKRMWDGESFEKHLKGRAHQQIIESVENSYKLKCNMMRESLRLEEEKRGIELNRMKRSGKNMKPQQLSQCNMCDLQFYGHLLAHRKTMGHQRLKAFLHPRCVECNKEFPNRMEWTFHNMTPEHLRKLWESASKEGLNDIPTEEEVTLEPVDAAKADEELFEDLEHNEPENVLLEFEENMTNISARIPIYKALRSVAESSIKPVSGFHCAVCPCFLLTEDEAKRHSLTQKHFIAFVNELNKRATEENKKQNKKREGAVNKADDEGNWKRRKVTTENDGVAGTDGKDKNCDENIGQEELYDPADSFKEVEVTGDAMILNETVGLEETIITESEPLTEDNCKLEDDEVWAEVDTIIATVKKEEESNAANVDEMEVAEVKEDIESDSPSQPTRASARKRNMRNGAGPKSKMRGRKSQ